MNEKKKYKSSENPEHVKLSGQLQSDIDTINDFIAKNGNIVFTKLLATCICSRISYEYIDVIFDSIPGFLPIMGNMVIDLKTSKCIPRTREHYFTFEIEIRYDPTAKSDLLDKFMASIMLEDDKSLPEQVKVLFLQRLLGYALTSECKEQIMAVLTGEEGSNGKSTLFRLVKTCFPMLAKSAQKSIIMKKVSSNAASPELHELKSARIVFVSETGVDEHIDEPAFKQMTGGDEVRSRFLYDNGETWTPKYVLFMLTNSIPKCSGDLATLRRILIFTFNAKFVAEPKLPHERKEDKNISDIWSKKEVREAFLNWMVIGARNYYNQGLNPPQEILSNTEDFKKSSDSFTLFIEAERDPAADPNDRTRFADIYSRYQQFCTEQNMTRMSVQALGKRLKAKYSYVHLDGYPTYYIKLFERKPIKFV